MIAYYFAPYSHVAGVRSTKFAKYWAAAGSDVSVYSANPVLYGEAVITGQDDGLPVRHMHAPQLGSGRLLNKLVFFLGACWHLLRHGREHDLVYVSGAPFYPFILAALFGWRLPFVLDFRDSWSMNPGFAYGRGRARPLRAWLARQVERISIRSAHLVVFCTRVLLEEYRAAFPESSAKFALVHNGFDPEDMAGIEPVRAFAEKTLVVSGSFLVYMPDFADLIAKFLRNRPDWRFLYLGQEASSVAKTIEEYGVAKNSLILPQMPRRQALAHVAGADLCLLTTGTPNGVGTKFYEYMALRKPIACFVPKNSAIKSEFEGVENVAAFEPPFDVDALFLAEAWFERNLTRHSKNQFDMRTYDRSRQAECLLEIMNGLISSRKCKYQ
ncbi:glycosyltransferase [Chitinolyticbacter meiyuanensis]|uniref:glycosyltransferase n=1 Tax=Chitinolyticbacter meiyuanensis TaxID=682798 RepID=UPI0016523EDD|nr:glycosyltransferase [Chitinolyticbacter meiyuanensis]